MDIKDLESFRIADALKFNDELNPELWVDGKLDPEVKNQLLLIAEDFISYLGIKDIDVKDITLSGSNAAYSYTPFSDIDLHILVDMSKYPNDDVYKELFDAKKILYGLSYPVRVHGIPVELYVQDINEPVKSLGEYSITKDDWIKRPKKEKAALDQNAVQAKYESLLKLVELALKTNDPVRLRKVMQILKRYRQAGLDKTGEYSPENLSYKTLRNQGYIKKLRDLQNKLHGEKLSIEESELLETPDENSNVNSIAKAVAHKIIKIANENGPEYANLQTGNGATAQELGVDTTNVKSEALKNLLKKLRFFVFLKSHPNDNERIKTSGIYVPAHTAIIAYLNTIIASLSKLDPFVLGMQLTNTIAHEMQHALDDEKSGGKAIAVKGNKNINPSSEEDMKKYLKRPHEINARFQEVLYYISEHMLIEKLRDPKELERLLRQYLRMNRIDEVLGKDSKEFKRILVRSYKFFMHELARFAKHDAAKKETPKSLADRAFNWIMKAMDFVGLEESSGYIPSKKEANDPRFKTALTVDVKPDAIKKNAKAFSFKTSRAGIPPQAKTNGKI